MPKTYQTTSYYSPDFQPIEGLKDTRPVFLGGAYISKIDAESKVGKYIRGLDATETRPAKADDDVSQYFVDKMEMNKSLEKIFLRQSTSKRNDLDENQTVDDYNESSLNLEQSLKQTVSK